MDAYEIAERVRDYGLDRPGYVVVNRKTGRVTVEFEVGDRLQVILQAEIGAQGEITLYILVLDPNPSSPVLADRIVTSGEPLYPEQLLRDVRLPEEDSYDYCERSFQGLLDAVAKDPRSWEADFGDLPL